MTESEYRSLCATCDRVLSAPASTLERISIPWLHVIRGHPVFLQNYAGIFPEPRVDGWNVRGRQFLRRCMGKCKQWWRLLRARDSIWYESDPLPAKADLIIVSHLLRASDAGHADDFYYGSVPIALAQQGYSVVIALIDHAGVNPKKVARGWKGSVIPRVILSNVAPRVTEFTIWRNMQRESRRLTDESKAAEGLMRKVLARAADEAVLGGALRARRIGWQIEELVRRLLPRALVVTYEGHAWERVAFASAKQALSTISCAGYQHAMMFPHQHAACRSLGGTYDPDHVLTAGAMAFQQMKGLSGFERVSFSILGSSRGFAAKTAGSASAVPDSRRGCLVLPEGIDSECHLLFGFSLDCAARCPEIDFVWRLHPVVAFATLQQKNDRLRSLPPNVRLSTDPMEADLAACACTLYRGTTAVVQAVGAGLRPVYLEIPGEMTVDPLHALGGWKAIVRTVDDFAYIAAEAPAAGASFAAGGPAAVKLYCQDIFTPFNPEVLKRLVDGPSLCG